MTIAERKADHIDLCVDGEVGFARTTTLLEQVTLIHDAVPELALDRIDTGARLFGKELRAPLVIAAMTGGTSRALDINRQLAALAEERGYGFGLGSQRPMLERPDDPSYRLRDLAPSCLIMGNLAAVQAREVGPARVVELCRAVGADAFCLHLNPAMELVQPGGDRDFTGVLRALDDCRRALDVPVVAKETGCGVGPAAAAKLRGAGIEHVDVSGAGGTSWVAVETERAGGAAGELGQALREWGVPTAASVLCAAGAGFSTIIATGGVATGLDVARAVALGAHAAGVARPVLQALAQGGLDGARRLLDTIEGELRAVMLLVGAPDLASLRRAGRILGEPLAQWEQLAGRGCA